MSVERGSHRIRSGDGESVLRDGLTFDEARAEHHRLSEIHTPHFWDVYSGPRAGWCAVAGLFESSDLQQAEAAARRTAAALS